MRIPVVCMLCSHDEREPSFDTYQAELQDDGLYYMLCGRGHRTVTCLQEQKFEVLFDIGANAIIDGYYREAITAFVACLERFFEFFVAVVCEKHQVPEDEFAQGWKVLVNQSERQLGAFVAAYLLEYRCKPPLLKEKGVSLRNAVIHKGKIPSREEAVAFGNEVLSLVVPILRKIKGDMPQAVGNIVSRHVRNTHQKIVGEQKIQFLTIATTISVVRANSESDPTLDHTFDRLSRQRARGRHYL